MITALWLFLDDGSSIKLQLSYFLGGYIQKGYLFSATRQNFHKVLFIEIILSLSQIFWLTEERREELCTDGDSFHNNKQTWIMLILKHAANKWVQTIIRDPSPVTISREYHSFYVTNHKIYMLKYMYYSNSVENINSAEYLASVLAEQVWKSTKII